VGIFVELEGRGNKLSGSRALHKPRRLIMVKVCSCFNMAVPWWWTPRQCLPDHHLPAYFRSSSSLMLDNSKHGLAIGNELGSPETIRISSRIWECAAILHGVEPNISVKIKIPFPLIHGIHSAIKLFYGSHGVIFLLRLEYERLVGATDSKDQHLPVPWWDHSVRYDWSNTNQNT